ncbi:hypothetical protein IscW_ISCW014578 [Ixodes scapularis]|uniref:Uncharacterized protein n=1 Tax=Ixodes scapularis TaxID=6945 RepID=B7QKV6_IXOSC|nr:hypothetical protein IscW_ISCW014578 [Ixodes scapularis]|eukprot:XP_002415811.1 hypothetical protein IscW_ISCW014578 [Ixodes scapularis]
MARWAHRVVGAWRSAYERLNVVRGYCEYHGGTSRTLGTFSCGVPIVAEIFYISRWENQKCYDQACASQACSMTGAVCW